MDMTRPDDPEVVDSAGGEPQGPLKTEAKQYSGLSVLEEEEFMNTNVPLGGRLDEEGHGWFHWEIDNWTQLPDRSISKTFTVAGHDWDILLFPRGNNAAETVSLYMEAKPKPDEEKDWHVCAQFGLVMSNADDPTMFRHSTTQHRFVAEESDWGFTRFSEVRHVITSPGAGAPALLEGGRVRVSAFVRVIRDPLGVLWHSFINYSSRKHTGYVGLRNQGATCYMNSLLQSLYFTNEFRNAVYQIPTEHDDPKKSVALALQRVFYSLQVSDEAVDTTELTKSFGWDSVESFMQHDVQEFNRVLQDNLETKMKGTVVDGAVARMFEGKMKSYIRCVDVEFESSRVENYYDISLNVKGCATLRDSFANYCEVETLDGENKYQAEGFGLQAARKGVIFESFPQVLQLQLKRFEYDFRRDAMIKINDRHEFPPTIDLGEFLSDDADRSEPWRYALHGVLVHSGDLHGGHYFGLLRPTAEDRWFRFDDDRVVPVAKGEVFEEYYGGDAAGISPAPGARMRPSSKRFTNAYMLVYIRESRRDSVLCGGDAPVPEHLLRRIQEDRAEEERQQRERQEMANTLVVKVIGAQQFARNGGFDLGYFDQRQPASNALFAERLPRDMTLADFVEHYARATGQAPDAFRMWTMVGRVNKTTRCDAPLVGDALRTTLAQVMESRSPRWSDLRLFCEPRPEDVDPQEFLSARPAPGRSLVHIKFFDVETQAMRGAGSIYVQGDQRVGDIKPCLRELTGLAPDTPILLFEEVKPALIEPMDLASTFHAAEIQSGDIICVQAQPAPSSSGPLVPDYFDAVQHQVSVRFVAHPSDRSSEDSESPDSTETPLVLEASAKLPYDDVAQWLANHLGMDDPLKLRFHTVSPTGQPRQPVRRMAATTLGDMLPNAMFAHAQLSANGIAEYVVIYERLEVDIMQIENMRSVRVAFVARTMREEHHLDVLVPKAGTSQELMDATRAKVVPLVAESDISLRFYAVAHRRVARVLTGKESLADLGFPGSSDVVAELATDAPEPMDTDDAAAPRFVEVFHFYRDLMHTHSVPFLFPIFPGEKWPATWTRLQRKLGMGDKELRSMGVVCGPPAVDDLKSCRIIQGIVETNDPTDSPSSMMAIDGHHTPTDSPPPPPQQQSQSEKTSDATPPESAVAVPSDSDGAEPAAAQPAAVEPSDDLCLWDVMPVQEPPADAAVPRPGAPIDSVAGVIGLDHVDRASRHRGLHHERAIRIRN
ncbi:ubiquitin-specific protease ubp15 [Coemansia sp. RSA 552]|nr:ubiquitin-specific protease ubp15 [Coemansia sp. RSA 552]